MSNSLRFSSKSRVSIFLRVVFFHHIKPSNPVDETPGAAWMHFGLGCASPPSIDQLNEIPVLEALALKYTQRRNHLLISTAWKDWLCPHVYDYTPVGGFVAVAVLSLKFSRAIPRLPRLLLGAVGVINCYNNGKVHHKLGCGAPRPLG